MIVVSPFTFFSFLFLLLSLQISPSSPFLVAKPSISLTYHKGPLLKGNITVNVVWYGAFSPSTRAVLLDFIQSLSSSSSPSPLHPSPASKWWDVTTRYNNGAKTTLLLGRQLFLKANHTLLVDDRRLRAAAAALGGGGGSPETITVVLTGEDVRVEGFCFNRCGSHGWIEGRRRQKRRKVYVWVGNAGEQCPGYCAWPFHQPVYGPQTSPLVPPNGEVGVDGMVINLAAMLAGAATNPYGDGFYQEGGEEAVSACAGVFGKGAYPGYPGALQVDVGSGASFNARGVNGRRFLLPAIWDPLTRSCSTTW